MVGWPEPGCRREILTKLVDWRHLDLKFFVTVSL